MTKATFISAVKTFRVTRIVVSEPRWPGSAWYVSGITARDAPVFAVLPCIAGGRTLKAAEAKAGKFRRWMREAD